MKIQVRSTEPTQAMANTYTQIYIQIVFAVKNREALIQKEWKERLHAYITGIVQSDGHKMLGINSMPDHIHLFIGYKPTPSIPDLVEEIKTSSNRFVKENRLSKFQFAWQKGYGAFSYSRSQIPDVARYIETQELHHSKKIFREEYLEMLRKFEVEFDEKYLFDFFD